MAAEPVDSDDYMLTTTDNPWNPYTNWEEWYAYDRDKGYDTPGYLARICRFSFDLSEEDQDLSVKNAIDEIVDLNILGIYRKITREEQVKISKGPGGGS
jgi:hypothetical protein